MTPTQRQILSYRIDEFRAEEVKWLLEGREQRAATSHRIVQVLLALLDDLDGEVAA